MIDMPFESITVTQIQVERPCVNVLIERVDGGFVATVLDEGGFVCSHGSKDVSRATAGALHKALGLVGDRLLFKVVPLTDEVETFFDDDFRQQFIAD